MKNSGNQGVDRIELMQTFVCIVESGSLSAAAQQLGTSQPTVSRRLKTLESTLGLQLLQRSTHVMKLTEDGERCFSHAKDLLENWNALDSDLRGIQNEPEGTLRVLVPHAFGQEHLIAPLTAYLQNYPHVTVEWQLHDSNPDFIAKGIDCAIQVGTVVNPSVVAVKLFDVPRIVVCAPELMANRQIIEHPKELSALPWLTYSPFYREEVSLVHRTDRYTYKFAIHPRLYTDNIYVLRNTVRAGLGAGVISSWIIADDIKEGRLQQLVPNWEAQSLPVYLVYPHARFYPVRLRLFLEAIRQMTPNIEGKVQAAETKTSAQK